MIKIIKQKQTCAISVRKESYFAFQDVASFAFVLLCLRAKLHNALNDTEGNYNLEENNLNSKNM